MKKISMFLTAMFLFVSVATLHAQSKGGDFFVGKWKVMVKGTPAGDSEMMVEFKRDDKGKMIGTSYYEDGSAPATTFSRIEAKEKNVTAYWVAQGYDVYLFLEKIGDNKVEGSLMDMFDASGIRVTE